LNPPLSVSAASLPPPSAAARAVADELALEFKGRVSTLEQDRLSYSRDLWPKALLWIRQGSIPSPPDLVVWPQTEEEVVRVIGVARAHRLAVIPFGAGSGVCGGVWAVQGGISLDLKRLDSVGQVDEEHRTVEAGAGVIGEVLERRLNAQGYSLGHFPSSIYMSTLGGWLAARSAGQFSNKYGKIEDMVLSVTAVTGAGEVVRTPERPCVGPDLAQLFIGSEGTLCAFTSAKLRVHPLPEHRTYRGFKFRSVAEGVEAIRLVYRAGLRPAVVRLYDPFDTALVGRERPHKTAVIAPALRSTLAKDIVPLLLRRLSPRTLGHPALLNRAADYLKHCLLVLLFEGEAKRAVREDEQAKALCQRAGGVDLGEEPGRHWYQKRYDVSYKMSKVVDAGAYADTMEVAATWDKVMDVYEKVREAMSPYAFVLCHFSHAYLEGCSLYFTFTASDATEADMERRYDKAWKVSLEAAISAGATVTHHHGVGLLKQTQLLQELGDGRRVLAALKKAYDPDGVMNPGKLGQ
jgi:alkyldihydroxyacetonephosphate synthase